jgi:hypothetical protein
MLHAVYVVLRVLLLVVILYTRYVTSSIECRGC